MDRQTRCPCARLVEKQYDAIVKNEKEKLQTKGKQQVLGTDAVHR